MLRDRLLTIINESGLKQKDLAASLGVSENYISLLVNGRKDVISETIALLMQEKYGYSSKWILTGEGDKFTSGKNTFIKQRTITLLKNLTDQEIAAVMAFVNSLEDIRKVFKQTESEETATSEIIAAHNDDTSEEQLKLMQQDIKEL